MQAMRRTRIALPLIAAALVCAAPAGAARSGRGPVEPQLTAEPQTAVPGGTVVLSGRGFPRNASIALLAGPPRSEAQRIGGAQTGRRGAFTATIRIRPQAAAGRLVALACYDACRVKATVHFRIVAP
jgi:hypothetical protein